MANAAEFLSGTQPKPLAPTTPMASGPAAPTAPTAVPAGGKKKSAKDFLAGAAPKPDAPKKTEADPVGDYAVEAGNKFGGEIEGSFEQLKNDWVKSQEFGTLEVSDKWLNSPIWDKVKMEWEGLKATGMLPLDALNAVLSPITGALRAGPNMAIAKGLMVPTKPIRDFMRSHSKDPKKFPTEAETQTQVEDNLIMLEGMFLPTKSAGARAAATEAATARQAAGETAAQPKSVWHNLIVRPMQSAQDFAKEHLRAKLKKEGVTKEQATAKIKQKGAALVDVGEVGGHMVGAGKQAALTDEGRRLGWNLFVKDRMRGRKGRVNDAVQHMTNDMNMFEFLGELDETRRVNARPLYEWSFQNRQSHAPLRTQFENYFSTASRDAAEAQKALHEADAQLTNLKAKHGASGVPSVHAAQAETGFAASGKSVNEARQAVQDADSRITMVESKYRDVGDNVYGNSARNTELKAAQKAKADAEAKLAEAEAKHQGASESLRTGQERDVSAHNASMAKAERAKALAEERVKKAETARTDALERLRIAQEHEAQGLPGGVWSPRVQEFIDDPLFKPGLKRGLEIQRTEALRDGVKFDPMDYGVTGYDAAGDPIVSKVPNLRLLDAAKRGVDSILRKEATNPLTRAFEPDELQRAQMGANQKFVEELDRLTDPTGAGGAGSPYRKAREAWAGPSAQMDAVHDGLKFDKLEPEQITTKLKNYTAHEREAYVIGVTRHLANKITSGTRDALKVAQDIVDDLHYQKQLKAAVGEDHFKHLHEMAEREVDHSLRQSQILGGSQTAHLREGSKEIDELGPGVEQVKNAVLGGLSGFANPSRWMARTGAQWAGTLLEGMSQARREAMAKLLFSTNEEDNLAAIEMLYEEGRITVPHEAGPSGRSFLPVAGQVQHQVQQQQDQPQQ